jgi:DNA-binding NarL/FixJ family response regulator
MPPIRVLIVDDQPQVRQALHTLLPLIGEIEIAGEAADGEAALAQAAVLQPDVVLMDLDMPIVDGCEAARQIKARQPACRVIALTIHADEASRQAAEQAGADDFVEKGAPLSCLLQAIGRHS